MPLINCEFKLIITRSANCFILAGAITNQVPTFAITNTKLYVLVVSFSTHDDARLLQQMKFGFKRAINWNKYQSKVIMKGQNQYLDNLIDPNRLNRLFVLSIDCDI